MRFIRHVVVFDAANVATESAFWATMLDGRVIDDDPSFHWARPHPGYWPSTWPVECGGNRRQKAAAGRLGAADGSARVTTRRNGRWNVMVVRRDPGQWFLGGTMASFTGPPPFGWVERIDPDTLEPRAASPELPCGEHVW